MKISTCTILNISTGQQTVLQYSIHTFHNSQIFGALTVNFSNIRPQCKVILCIIRPCWKKYYASRKDHRANEHCSSLITHLYVNSFPIIFYTWEESPMYSELMRCYLLRLPACSLFQVEEEWYLSFHNQQYHKYGLQQPAENWQKYGKEGYGSYVRSLYSNFTVITCCHFVKSTQRSESFGVLRIIQGDIRVHILYVFNISSFY